MNGGANAPSLLDGTQLGDRVTLLPAPKNSPQSLRHHPRGAPHASRSNRGATTVNKPLTITVSRYTYRPQRHVYPKAARPQGHCFVHSAASGGFRGSPICRHPCRCPLFRSGQPILHTASSLGPLVIDFLPDRTERSGWNGAERPMEAKPRRSRRSAPLPNRRIPFRTTVAEFGSERSCIARARGLAVVAWPSC